MSSGTSRPDSSLDIYYPDASVTSERIREIIAHIARFHIREEVVEAKAYFSSLPAHDRADLHVTRNIVLLYVDYGFYTGAEDALQHAKLDELLDQPHALLREEVASLALLSAEVACARRFKVKDAVALADEIDQIYMTRICLSIDSPMLGLNLHTLGESSEDDVPEDINIRRQAIIRQRTFWSISSEDAAADAATHTLTDARVGGKS